MDPAKRQPLKEPLLSVSLLAMRLLFALPLSINHGWPTFKNLINGQTEGYPDPLGLGPLTTMAIMGTVEFIGALAIVLGLFTRLSALALAVGFGVAVFVHHAADPFSGKELAYMYFSAFVVLLLTGPGRFSADFLLFGKNSRR